MERENSCTVATLDAFVKSKVNELKKELCSLEPFVRKKCVDELIKTEKRLHQSKLDKVLSSIKEVIRYSRSSRNRESESFRSTLISAACGPNISLKTVAEVLGIYYGNQHKLDKYRQRRKAYMSGAAKNMNGDRYLDGNYGFPKKVLDVVREFFESPECGTPDI